MAWCSSNMMVVVLCCHSMQICTSILEHRPDWNTAQTSSLFSTTAPFSFTSTGTAFNSSLKKEILYLNLIIFTFSPTWTFLLVRDRYMWVIPYCSPPSLQSRFWKVLIFSKIFWCHSVCVLHASETLLSKRFWNVWTKVVQATSFGYLC